MRNARAHKLQWSGPTVQSSTVTRFPTLRLHMIVCYTFNHLRKFSSIISIEAAVQERTNCRRHHAENRRQRM